MTKIPHPLQSSAIARPTHPAIVSGSSTHTYAELRDKVAQTGSRLEAMGIHPGDRIGLVGEINVDWLISCLAISWIGAVVAPISSKAPPAEQRRVLDLMGVKILLTDVASAETIASADPKVQPVVEEPTFALKAERFWDMNETRVVMATSGSTSKPKVVKLSTEQIFYSAMGSTIRLGHHLDDRWLLCLPAYHIGGLSVLFRCIWLGTTIVLEPSFAPHRINSLIDQGSVSQISLTPTMLRALLDARNEIPFPDTLRVILVGGGATDEALIKRSQALSAPIVCTWGMTETASQAATSIPGQDPSGPYPPMPFARIHEDEERLTIQGPIAGSNGFKSQDTGHVTSDGMVQIKGRADRTITSGGAQINLTEIEETLKRYPGVQEAYAIGIADAKWGQRPVVLIVPHAHTEELEEETILAWCREELSSFKVPDRIIFTTEPPINEMGKTQYAKLATFFQDSDTDQSLGELGGKTNLLETVHGNEGMDQPDSGAEAAIDSTENLVGKGNGVGAEALDGNANPQALSHLQGTTEVSFSVDQGHAPSAPLEDTLEGLPTSSQHLLKNVMAVLKGTTKKSNTGTINVMKADRDLVLKNHSDNSQGPAGKKS